MCSAVGTKGTNESRGGTCWFHRGFFDHCGCGGAMPPNTQRYRQLEGIAQLGGAQQVGSQTGTWRVTVWGTMRYFVTCT